MSKKDMHQPTNRYALRALLAALVAPSLLLPTVVSAQQADGPPPTAPTSEAGAQTAEADRVEPGANDEATPATQATTTTDSLGRPLVQADENRVREYFRPVINRPGGLTSNDAASSAAKVAPQARAARASIDSAEAQVDAVIWNYLPRLTVSASYTRLSPQPTTGGDLGGNLLATTAPAGPVDPATAPIIAIDATNAFQQLPNQWMLTAGLTVPFSDYILNMSKAVSGANTALDSARLNEQAERVNAAANARLAYYGWARAKLTAREATKSVERAKKQLETITAQYDAGRMARADVLRSDAFLANTELNLRRANTSEAIAREQLNVIMTGGVEAQPQWEIGEDVMADPGAAAREAKTISELQDEALTQRLEVLALGERAEALREKAKVERTQAYPRVEGFANAMYANPNPRINPQVEEWLGTWDVGVRAVWTINDLGTKYATARQSDADAAQVDAQIEAIEFALRQEVISEYRTLQEATLARTSAYRGWQAAEAGYLDRVTLFQNGRATSLDLLEVETSLVQARLDLVSAYIAQRTARVRLDHALGRDIEGVIGPRTK